MPDRLPEHIDEVLQADHVDFSETTLQVYRAAWRDLLKWWASQEGTTFEMLRERVENASPPLPSPELISEYLEAQMDLAWSTLTNRRQAIRLVYRELSANDPFEKASVESVWGDIREKRKEEKSEGPSSRRKDLKYGPAEVIEDGLQLLSGHLKQIRENPNEWDPESSSPELIGEDLKYLPRTVARPDSLTPDQKQLIPKPTYDMQVLRNRALLLLIGTTSATRRQITGINVSDLRAEGREVPIWIVLHDQDGYPEETLDVREVPDLQFCTARALAAWVLGAELEGGPLFRSFTPHGRPSDSGIQPQTINHVIRRCAKSAGLDPNQWSTRALRSGA